MNRFKNILCIVESGKPYKPALERASALAENNQATLTITEVIPRITASINMPDGGPISAELQAAMVTSHTQNLKTVTASCCEQIDIHYKVLLGTPFMEIIREVLRGGYDLVIKLPEKQDWLDRLFGSNDMHLLRKCPCPVWLIKPQAPTSYRRILATVDVDDAYSADELESQRVLNRQILEMASSLTLSSFAELHIAHAWDTIGESVMQSTTFQMPDEEIKAYVKEVKHQHAKNLDRLIDEVIGNMGPETADYLNLQKHLVRGSAQQEIPELARRIKADLVVMGTVARTGIPGFFMGNTAETILNQLDCSVLAIKPPGFVTPVTLDD